MRMLLLILPVVLLIASDSSADSGQVTWLWHSDDVPFLRVDSVVDGIQVHLRRGERVERDTPNERVEVRELITNRQQFEDAYWRLSGGVIFPHGGGSPLRIRVTGLPFGRHIVHIRYYAHEGRSINMYAKIINAQPDGRKYPGSWSLGCGIPQCNLISGLGYSDPGSLWDLKMGTAGNKEEPTSEVTLQLERGRFHGVLRVQGIFIDSYPSLDQSATQAATPENQQMQEKILSSGPTDEDGQTVYGVKVASGSLKIKPKSFDSIRGYPLADAIIIRAARGEWENRQVVVYSPSQDLSNVQLEVSPLRGDDGNVIASENLLLAPVGFVKIGDQFARSLHGWEPSPILDYMREVTIKQHDVQPLWYRVFVPRDAAAGTYRGSVTVRPDNAPAYTVPVNLEVWDFTVPQSSQMNFVVGGQHRSVMVQYKMQPVVIYGGFDPGNPWPDEELAEWKKRGVRRINVAYFKKAQVTDEDIQGLLARIDSGLKALERHGLRDSAYTYMYDEAPGAWIPTMRRVSAAVKERFADLPIATTFHDATYGQESNLPDIDIWCQRVITVDPDRVAAARKRGKTIWYYTAGPTQKPMPGLLYSNSYMDTRQMLGFMAFAYGSQGFLFHNSRVDYAPVISSEGAYTNCQPRLMFPQGPGDGALYLRGPHGPLPSARMEAIRDGLEDYDYLYIARELMVEVEAKDVSTPGLSKLAARIRPYFALENDLVQSATQFIQAPEQLTEARQAVAQYIVMSSALLQ